MKQYLLSAVIFLALATSAIAQTVVKGTITDSETNEAVIGANVSIKGTTIGAMTNFEGNFSFEAKEGSKVLLISFVGYETVEKVIEVSGSTMNVGTIALDASSIGLSEVQILASVVTDRKTPVSVSTISPLTIEDKLGTQEFPEILKSTPGVYATKGTGGGYGDGRVNLRGFDSNNIGVLINGVPVNDMESGKVYWSNWAGLSDVTKSTQVQRGLGASKLAISSVGGTINVITKTTDAKKGGSFGTWIGNDGYLKNALTLSTGLMENGLAVTVSGSRAVGDGYIDATSFEAWSYFGSIAYKINNNHELSLTGFGAPQTHNQRNLYKKTISDYDNHNRKWNNGWGHREGDNNNNGGYGYNYYHKPQISLNHYWTISENTSLATAAYVSIGSGGGRRNSGLYASRFSNDPNELIDWNKYTAQNEENVAEGKAVKNYLKNSVNNHKWYGVLSSLNHDLNERLSFTGGLDLRYYKGEHYREVDDVLVDGGFVPNKGNINLSKDAKVYEGDKTEYYNDGIVKWYGVFGQLEYSHENISAFLSTAVNNTSYQRVDYFQYASGSQESSTENFVGYSAKGGASYTLHDGLTAKHIVFANGGYFTRAPYFSAVFPSNTNTVEEDVKNEEALSFELGYKLEAGIFRLDVNAYRTSWQNKSFKTSTGELDAEGNRLSALISGQDALHQGIELETTIEATEWLTIKGMLSLGDWTWKNDVKGVIFNEANQVVKEVDVYAKDLKVGDAAQTTAALGLNFKPTKALSFGVDYTFAGDYYAKYDPSERSLKAGEVDEKITNYVQPYELPSFGLFDLNAKYKWNLGNKKKLTFYANVNNLFDTEYWADAQEGGIGERDETYVWAGFGRTWSVGVKFNF